MTGPEEAARQLHEDEAIRIIDLADEQGVVRNHDFLRCEIWGPALLLPSACIFRFNYIEGAPNDCIYSVEAGRQRYVGAIIIFECGFESCIFRNVGFTGPPDYLRAMKGSISPPP